MSQIIIISYYQYRPLPRLVHRGEHYSTKSLGLCVQYLYIIYIQPVSQDTYTTSNQNHLTKASLEQSLKEIISIQSLKKILLLFVRRSLTKAERGRPKDWPSAILFRCYSLYLSPPTFGFGSLFQISELLHGQSRVCRLQRRKLIELKALKNNDNNQREWLKACL